MKTASLPPRRTVYVNVVCRSADGRMGCKIGGEEVRFWGECMDAVHDTFFAVAPAAADQNDGLLPSESPGKLDTCSNMQQLRWLGRFGLDFDKGIDYCSIPFI